MARADTSLQHVPPSLFLIAAGLAAFALGMKQAEELWQLPVLYSPYLLAASVGSLVALIGLYLAKIARYPATTRREFSDASAWSHAGAIPASLALLALACGDDLPALSRGLVYAAGALVVALIAGAVRAAWRRHTLFGSAACVPVTALVLLAAAGARYFPPSLAWLCLALGMLAWIGLVLAYIFRADGVRRSPALALGVAPPAGACIAYIQLAAHADGYALALYVVTALVAVAFIAQLPWLVAQSFSSAWWSCALPLGLYTGATIWMYDLTLAPLYKSLALASLFACAATVVSLLLATAVATARGQAWMAESRR